MPKTYRIFCDESCHLENDEQTFMILGGLIIDDAKYHKILGEIKQIRIRYKMGTEFKWTKISKSRLGFYQALIDLFLQEPSLKFRAVIVNKKVLNHGQFNYGEHDIFYYKMFYYVLDHFINTEDIYKAFFDYKDTKSRLRLNKLKEVFDNKYRNKTNIHLQSIRSHESDLIQLADLFIGAVSYKVRDFKTSMAKLTVADYLEEKTERSLTCSTPLFDKKFNLFFPKLQ